PAPLFRPAPSAAMAAARRPELVATPAGGNAWAAPAPPELPRAAGSKALRNGPNVGALSALLIAVLVGSFLFLGAFSLRSQGRSGGLTIAAEGPRRVAEGLRRSVAGLPEAVQHSIVQGLGDARHGLDDAASALGAYADSEDLEFLFERLSVQPVAGAVAGAVTRSARRLVLLDDAPSSDAEALDALYADLEDDGVQLLGRRGENAREADELGLVAGARHAAGVGSPEDAAARERLQAFLAEHPEVDGVLWIGRRNQDGGLRGLLLPAHGVEAGAVHTQLASAAR
ncbi:MAG TPA: hypothetical protein VGC54_08920, partial [Planctomycetota bacterium]